LGDRAETIEKLDDGTFIVTTQRGIKHHAPVVAIAGGLGSFEPRKPPIPNLVSYEDKGVEYIIREPELYRDKKIIIAGGGDSALDWSIFLTNVAKEVTLVHRRTEFRGALDSVEKVQELVANGKMKLLTNSEIKEIHGANHVESVTVKHKTDGESNVEVDHFIPLFGLSPKLGPIGNWGLEIEKNAIVVDNATDYKTNIEGVFAIGDVNTYPGKLKLILCGFHEATIMVQAAYKIINPDAKRLVLKYTTVSGVTGFDGVKKEQKKAVVKKI
jgi:thioredoxin reductase (NADPH)